MGVKAHLSRKRFDGRMMMTHEPESGVKMDISALELMDFPQRVAPRLFAGTAGG